jgi:hypothetical protein
MAAADRTEGGQVEPVLLKELIGIAQLGMHKLEE